MRGKEAVGYFAIIPAGGIGSRLWPLSRAAAPKFLLDLTGEGHSLLQGTFNRLLPAVGADHIYVVTGVAHQAAVQSQLPNLPANHLLTEPIQRDSAAAICYAAAVIERDHPGATVGSFPADHLIGNPAEFRRIVQQAVAAADAGYLATIGITPTGPSTAFGYIQTDGALDADGAPDAKHVRQFVEKPQERIAQQYYASGDYLWNAGMFVAKASNLLGWLKDSRPALYEGIMRIVNASEPQREGVKAHVWPTLEKIAIDYAIAEPVAAAGNVAVVPGDFDWDDVGDFSAVARQIRRRNPGNLAILGPKTKVLADSSNGVVVSETGRLICLVGLDDAVVVDTPDVLLVTNGTRAQQVKDMVNLVRGTGNGGVL
jgi:mannose-1-phosphate guanylyltransferase